MIETYGVGKMAALLQALVVTLNIDAALLQVYGFDEYGLDSLWRQSLGLEPLPRPEPATPQQRSPSRTRIAPTPRPTLALAANPAAPPAATATATPQPTATPSPEPPPTAAPTPPPTTPAAFTPVPLPAATAPPPPTVNPPPPANTGGCNPAAAQGKAGELALMLLLVSPAALLLAGRRRFR